MSHTRASVFAITGQLQTVIHFNICDIIELHRMHQMYRLLLPMIAVSASVCESVRPSVCLSCGSTVCDTLDVAELCDACWYGVIVES